MTVTDVKKMTSKNRGLRRVLVLFIAFCLSLVYLSGAIQFGATDEGFFDKTFKALGSQEKVGLSDQDFEAVKQQLIDYVGLETETFSTPVTIDGQTTDFFNDKERAHMVDVRNLFVLNDRILKLALIAVLALYGIGRYGLKYKGLLIDGLSLSGLVLIGFAALLGLVASQDFTAVFTKFHELFFTNDLWLLDPATDRMIVLLEETFFSKMAVHIGLYAVLTAMAATALGIVAKRNQ